jgi:hypothetical protein
LKIYPYFSQGIRRNVKQLKSKKLRAKRDNYNFEAQNALTGRKKFCRSLKILTYDFFLGV